MKLHDEDLEAARYHQATSLTDFPSLSAEQRAQIRERARRYLDFYRAHPGLHNAVSVLLLAGLFVADWLALLALPEQLPFDRTTAGGAVLAGLVAGAVHGWLVCSIVTYSLHEGAAHDRIIQGQGTLARALRLFANNACRLFLADPVYYNEGHYSHHRGLGTREDGSFTHFVRARRLALALLPMAPFMSLSDYFPWRPQESTPSRKLSIALTNAYIGISFAVIGWQRGWIYAAVALFVVGSWVSFALDRVRESTEHLFLPLDRHDGTRDFGLGFWGLLLGGGPWGQPCHLSHHLEPALPWYQQIGMHLHLRRILTPAQKRAFFLRPLVGFPALVLRLVTARGAS